MKDMTLIEQYMVCAADEKGRISSFNRERQVCLVAAGLLQMQMEGILEIDEKAVTVTGALPEGMTRLASLYRFLDQGSPVKMERILSEYNFSLNDKRLCELMEDVGGSLVKMGLAREAKPGFFGDRKGFIPEREAIHGVIDMVRAELLEDGEITEDVAALVVLLERGKCLKTYFSEFERREMQEKIDRISDTPKGRMVRKMVETIDDMMGAFVTSLMLLS